MHNVLVVDVSLIFGQHPHLRNEPTSVTCHVHRCWSPHPRVAVNKERRNSVRSEADLIPTVVEAVTNIFNENS